MPGSPGGGLWRGGSRGAWQYRDWGVLSSWGRLVGKGDEPEDLNPLGEGVEDYASEVPTTMEQPLPHFDDPPIVETALSVQFTGLSGFRNTHLGLFWARHREEFPHVTDADPILSQREVFGEERQLVPRPARIRFGSDPAARAQMASQDQTRMVQVQNGRLVFNWRRIGNGAYPRWESVKPALLGFWKDFVAFAGEHSLGTPKPNQWEVVYVNHLLKGRDWESADDWSGLVPGLLGPGGRLVGAELEAMTCSWHAALSAQRGRLHIDLSHAFATSNRDPDEEPKELLVLQLTARGPMPSGGDAVAEGLELGHVAIVRNFEGITGKDAQRRWGSRS